MIKNMNRLTYLWMVLIGLLLSTSIRAQYVEVDSLYAGRKNTLSFLVNPILPPLMGSYNGSLHLALTYKRVVNNGKRFKIAGFYDFYDLTQNNGLINPNSVIPTADSSVIINQTEEYYGRMSIRTGFEWGDYTEKFGKYYGADLHVGYSKAKYKSYDHIYIPTPVDSLNSDYNYNNVPDTMLGRYDYNHYFLNLGLVANVGYRVVIKEKLEFNFTFSPEFNFNIPIRYQWNMDTPKPTQYQPANSFDLQLRMLLVDVGYRF